MTDMFQRGEATHLILDGIKPGREYHRHICKVGILLDPAAGFISVEARHDHVQKDQVRHRLSGDIDRLLARARKDDLIILFQHGGDQLRAEGVRVESLAIVESMDHTTGQICFRD